LLDPQGQPVEFSVIVSNNSAERIQMATMIQEDLKQVGIKLEVTKLELGSILDRIQKTREFEACILSLGSTDADPNPDLPVWLSSGSNHFWNPSQSSPATPWEAEIDSLMKTQQVTSSYSERKRMFDRVQALVVENLPLIPLVSPHLLAGAKRSLVNFRPALIEPHLLWNVEQLYWRAAAGARP
jgi:peptide/nickel transport system substrate-binding protein